MGGEQSTQNNLDWQENPEVIYNTDMWTLKEGICSDGTRVSLFESKHENKEDLERLSKHLRTLRHPCVVKHLCNSKKKNQLHLVTERVIPLEILLCEQKISVVETIAGIYSILQALEFIHDRCRMSHQNVCTSSVFVCTDGCWKLAGFEKMQTVNNNVDSKGIHYEDIYSFGQFALHLLSCQEELPSIPGGVEFVTRLETECLRTNSRPTCSELKNDLIFKNDFLDIRLSLQNLVLKSEAEKQQFFRSLILRLQKLHPQLIAHHLSSLLLCRFVFMDAAAVEYFLPYMLKPQIKTQSLSNNGLFPPEVFQEYIIPHLLRIFCVHNRHIRLILLKTFSDYVHLFTETELTNTILPQILLGIRDTDDQMVSRTLEALAKLVLILGAQVVVGGCRQKLFNEAIPKIKSKNNQKAPANSGSKSHQSNIGESQHLSQTDIPIVKNLPPNITDSPPDGTTALERSSPDGLESMEEDDWSDWEEEIKGPKLNVEENEIGQTGSAKLMTNSLHTANPIISSSHPVAKKKELGLGEEYDIATLDISVVSRKDSLEDFFSDMEPKIVTAKSIFDNPTENISKIPSSFAVQDELTEVVSGWDDTELEIN